MIYLLKTTDICNNNCVYCKHLRKKSAKKKSLKMIKSELRKAVKQGYDSVRLSCNTDSRSDFLNILKLAKELDLKIILETNGRVFNYIKNVQKIDESIYGYELYFSYINSISAYQINEIEDGFYEQTILGIKNIIKIINNPDKLVIKILLLNQNASELADVVKILMILGVRNVKFIYPFRNSEDDMVPLMPRAVKAIDKAKHYAEQNGIKVIYPEGFDYNPFYAEIKDYLDTDSAKLKIDKKIFKNKPHFSVIIPTHNKSKLLKHVIKSFFDQNYEKNDFELIIVDDGGNDKTYEMIKSLKVQCNLKYIYWPRVRDKKNAHYKKFASFYNRAGQTRNIGLSYADGNIILFNDDDIIAEKYCLQKHNEYHQENDNLVVRGFRMFLPDGFSLSQKNISNFDLLYKEAEGESIIKKRMQDCRYYELASEGWEKVISANLSIRRNNIDKVDGFSNDSPFWGYEDVEFGYKLKLAKMKLVWSDRIKVFHLPHKKQIGDIYQTMATFWINTNIFYRKYLDRDIYELYQNVILRHLDDSILYE